MNHRIHPRMRLLPLSTFVKVGLIFAIMLTFVGVSVHAQSAAPTCDGDQLEKVRDFGLTFVRAMNDGNLDEWYSVLADDYQLHSSMVDFKTLDKDGARAAMQALLNAFPGFQSEVHMSLVSTDCRYVTYYWTSSGTFTGAFGDMQPTGNAWTVSGINIAEVDSGEIVQEWNTFDRLTLMNQLGVSSGAATPESATQEVNPMSEEAVMHFVEQFNAIFDGPNLGIADEIFAPDFVGHLPLTPALDRQGWKDYVASFYAAFSDLRETVNEVIIGEDRVVLYVTYTGTQDGPLFGIPATGKPVSMDGIGIFRFDANGQVAENWAVIDVAGMLAQIGAFPPASS